MPELVLAGDIGGTNTRLCLAECSGRAARLLRQHTFESRAFAGISEIVREFLSSEKSARPGVLCLAVAGPVRSTSSGQAVRVTNLPWVIDSVELAASLNLAHVRLLNDFEALGHGIDMLSNGDFEVLQAGAPVDGGPRAVIGAGTGLGQAVLVANGADARVFPTEGGHAGFGPENELELELAHWLIEREGRSSWERVLSGPGLVRLYKFVCERARVLESPAVSLVLNADDAAAAITRAAMEQRDVMANAALDLFVTLYGRQAGNLALTVGATGGVYVAGGIAPRILARLANGSFLRAFLDKGRMRDYVSAIPLRVVKNTTAGLLGAAHIAAQKV